MSTAVRFAAFGGPEVLELVDIAEPAPGPGEVLLAVRAAGVNFADIAQRRNAYLWEPPLPFVPGYEAAGTILAVGDGVTDRQEGQRVLAVLPHGGYSSHLTVAAAATVPLPDRVAEADATALVVQGLSAYHILTTRAGLRPGDSVLVHAAAGGLGSLAVQMAKLLGAGTVIATAGSHAKLDRTRELGADVTINYRKDPDWPAAVRKATGGRGVDIVLEMLGGANLGRDLTCLAPFGRVVVFGAAGGPPEPIAPMALMGANQTIHGFYLAPVLEMPELLEPSLTQLMSWLATGELRVDVTRFALGDAHLAHEQMEQRLTTGKVVLEP